MSLPSVVPPERRLPAPRLVRRWGDGASRVRAAGVLAGLYLCASLVTTAAVLLVHSGRSVAASPPEVRLEANGAPLGDVLAHLAAVGGGEARLANDVPDRVAGPLVGPAAELIALLADAHGLTLHRDGRTLWFDREGRGVVDFVPLEKPMIVRALETLAAPVAPGGSVQVEASGRGLVLSGSRAYVRTSLARIAMATGVAVEPAPPAAPDALSPQPGPRAAVDVGDGASFAARIVLVSSRPPRYVDLDDGTRLVEGTILADGRRLAAIERGRLVFDAGGIETALALP